MREGLKRSRQRVGMLDKKAPEQNIIYQSTKNILFWYQKKPQEIENARLNLLFVPTLHDCYFNKEIPSTVAQIQVEL